MRNSDIRRGWERGSKNVQLAAGALLCEQGRNMGMLQAKGRHLYSINLKNRRAVRKGQARVTQALCSRKGGRGTRQDQEGRDRAAQA